MTGRYVDEKYHLIDPAFRRAFVARRPFTWAEAEADEPVAAFTPLSAERRRLWAEDALLCPVFGTWGELGLMVFVSASRIELRAEALAPVHGLANLLYQAFLDVTAQAEEPFRDLPKLSRRESECVFWCLQGKTLSDMAGILGISPHTVRDYTNSAMKKLGAVNREQMVLKALISGTLISHR